MGNIGPSYDEIKEKKEQAKADKEAKLSEIKACIDSGMSKDECIDAKKEEEK